MKFMPYVHIYQNYVVIFGILKTMSMWHTSTIVVCNTSWEARTAFSKSFNFPKSNYAFNHITFLHNFVICTWIAAYLKNAGILRFEEKCWWFDCSLEIGHCHNFGMCEPFPLTSKIWILQQFFWYAHIWHEFHIFQVPVKCAWWVISKCAHIIRYQAMYISQIVASEFFWMFYMKRWIFTKQKVSPLLLY